MFVNRLVVGRGVSQKRIEGTGYQSRRGSAEKRGDNLACIKEGCLKFGDTSPDDCGQTWQAGVLYCRVRSIESAW